MKELTELKKLSKMELLNKCRDLQVKELARIKYEKQQNKVRKWFSRKEESIPEEKKMNETNELKLEFRKVSSIPKSLSGNSQCSETIEKIKSTLLSLDVGEILHIPINDLYTGFTKDRKRVYCSQYETKFNTAIKHLKKANPNYNFKPARRNNDLYIQRLG